MPGEISHDLLPTYLIWYENQGDVVPLNRGKNKLIGSLELEPNSYTNKIPKSGIRVMRTHKTKTTKKVARRDLA